MNESYIVLPSYLATRRINLGLAILRNRVKKHPCPISPDLAAIARLESLQHAVDLLPSDASINLSIADAALLPVPPAE